MLIDLVAEGDWWVDMESSMRTEDDWFSVEKASEAIQLFYKLSTSAGINLKDVWGSRE